jgi:hypothetical protein
MSDTQQQPGGEQIPPGFTPEVWNQLTPEQKAQYMQGGQQQGMPAGVNPQNQQADMMKTMQKTMILSMAFSFLSTIFYQLIGRFMGGSNDNS